MPTTKPTDHMSEIDAQGRVLTCEKYPLSFGDSLTIHSCQVRGMIDGYAHFALPGRYVITTTSETEVVLMKCDTRTQFQCGKYDLRAMLGDWSDYKGHGHA